MATTRHAVSTMRFGLLFLFCGLNKLVEADEVVSDSNNNYEITTNSTNHRDEHDQTILTDGINAFLFFLKTLQVAILVLVSLSGLVFVAGILSSKKTRELGYNLYLVFMVVPDTMLNGYTAFKEIVDYDCSLSSDPNLDAITPVYLWVFFFYYTSNFYLNSVVAYEIHGMALKSFRREKSKPPSPSRVFVQSACIYAAAGLFAFWMAIESTWSPMTIDRHDRHTIPKLGSPSERGAFGFGGTLAIMVVVFAIPTTYVVYVRYDIWKNNLLPRSGKTRTIFLYYMRILLVFFGCYIPCIAASFFFATVAAQNHVALLLLSFSVHIFFAMQALLTLFLAMEKNDIRNAIWDFSGRLFCLRLWSGFLHSKSKPRNHGNIRGTRQDDGCDIGEENSPPRVAVSDIEQPTATASETDLDEVDQKKRHDGDEWEEADIYWTDES